jgi:hypothetical protein
MGQNDEKRFGVALSRRACCLAGRHDSGRVAGLHGAGVPQRWADIYRETAAFVSGANPR